MDGHVLIEPDTITCCGEFARRTEQNDPHFKDYILFYEYFHGDTGKGYGVSHQTVWTGLIAKLIH